MSGLFTLQASAQLSCDVLIIGSGAGAAAAATRLISAGRDVLMIEEGPFVTAADAPEGLSKAMPLMWRSGGVSAAIGNPPIAFAEGRCVGGGTEVNSAIFQTAPEEVLKRWGAKFGLSDIAAGDLAPYYDQVAKLVSASEVPGPLGPPTDRLREAGERMGWKVTTLHRAHSGCVGTNQCSAGCPTGAKQSVTNAILPDLLRGGLRLVANCRVRKLVVRRGRVVRAIAATQTPAGPRSVEIRCRHVFLCGGATQSPALLQRSGLGLSVAPFQLHPTIRLLARFKEPANAAEHRLPLAAITEFMPDLRFGGSVFTLGSFGMAIAEDWASRSPLLPDHRHFAIYYAMIRAEGRGWVRSIPGLSEPIVGYGITDRDWTRLLRGAEMLGEGLFAAGADLLIPSVGGAPPIASPKGFCDISPNLARSRAALMSIHIFSSLPLDGARNSVVDSVGRVRELANLHVADASLVPESLGVNPQATVMALAARTADAFLAEYS